MKRLVILLLILFIALSFSSCEIETLSLTELNGETKTKRQPITIKTKENYTHNIYRININSECVYNNSVGNEWHQYYSIDGEEIFDGDKISVPIDLNTVTIYIQVTEMDKSPDTASKNITLDLSNTSPTKVEMIITEDGPKYNGNTAKWGITVSAELIDRE